MTVLLTESQFNTLVTQIGLVIVALVGAGASLTAAYMARGAKRNSEEAKVSAAEAANEVKTNGGMGDPNPNLNDHVKYQTQMAEDQKRTIESLLQVALPLVGKVDDIDRRFTDHLTETQPLIEQVKGMTGKLDEHIQHSKVMDKALAEVYLTVKPDVQLDEDATDDN